MGCCNSKDTLSNDKKTGYGLRRKKIRSDTKNRNGTTAEQRRSNTKPPKDASFTNPLDVKKKRTTIITRETKVESDDFDDTFLRKLSREIPETAVFNARQFLMDSYKLHCSEHVKKKYIALVKIDVDSWVLRLIEQVGEGIEILLEQTLLSAQDFLDDLKYHKLKGIDPETKKLMHYRIIDIDEPQKIPSGAPRDEENYNDIQLDLFPVRVVPISSEYTNTLADDFKQLLEKIGTCLQTYDGEGSSDASPVVENMLACQKKMHQSVTAFLKKHEITYSKTPESGECVYKQTIKALQEYFDKRTCQFIRFTALLEFTKDESTECSPALYAGSLSKFSGEGVVQFFGDKVPDLIALTEFIPTKLSMVHSSYVLQVINSPLPAWDKLFVEMLQRPKLIMRNPITGNEHQETQITMLPFDASNDSGVPCLNISFSVPVQNHPNSISLTSISMALSAFIVSIRTLKRTIKPTAAHKNLNLCLEKTTHLIQLIQEHFDPNFLNDMVSSTKKAPQPILKKKIHNKGDKQDISPSFLLPKLPQREPKKILKRRDRSHCFFKKQTEKSFGCSSRSIPKVLGNA